jgi:hypothetical protein
MTFPKMSPGSQRWSTSAPVRYPDPDILVLDPRFEPIALPDVAIERVATGCRFTEGPAWFGNLRQLVYSDIPNDRLMRWDEETGTCGVLRKPAGYPDGNTRPTGPFDNRRAGHKTRHPHRARRHRHGSCGAVRGHAPDGSQ